MGKKRRQKHQGEARGKMVIPAYFTEQAAVTRPNDIFAFPTYFLYHWIPLLGPGLAWLVVALKERADDQGRTHWCISDLAEEIGVSGDAVHNWLGNEYARWFIRDPERETLRDAVAAHIQSSPPTPQHLAGVAALLQHHLPPEGESDRAEAAIDAMRRILAADRVHRQVLEAADSSPWRVNASSDPLTVLQVVWQVAGLPAVDSIPREQFGNLLRLSLEIEAAITLAGFYGYGTNYFRRNWVPLLGPELAWLVVYLQNYRRGGPQIGYVFDRQMDDQAKGVTVPMGEVTAIIGGASLGELLAGEYASIFVRLEETEGDKLTFQVRVNDPVVPGTVLRRVAEQIDDGCWVPVLPGNG